MQHQDASIPAIPIADSEPGEFTSFAAAAAASCAAAAGSTKILAWIVGASVVVGVTLLIMVLYRVLRMDYPRENAEFYYKRTLQLLIFGITFSFLGAFIDLFSNFMTD